MSGRCRAAGLILGRKRRSMRRTGSATSVGLSILSAERRVDRGMADSLHLRVHYAEAASTLVYLPGLHGDWTLLGPFRAAVAGKARLVETTYPRRPEWSLDDY